MNLLFLGTSRNIGHHVASLVLASPDPAYADVTLTLLVRRPLPEGDSLQPFVESGRVRLVLGDALDREAVKQAWLTAGGAQCDGVLFSVGTPLNETSFSLTKGFIIKTSNLTTMAMLNLLAVIRAAPGSPSPPLIAISSLGLADGEARLPLSLRMMYRYLIHSPHVDKLALEHLLRQAGTRLPADASIPVPSDDVLSSQDLDLALPLNPRTGSRAFLSDITIVRPAFLTDAPERLHAKKRGFVAGEKVEGPRTVSREEVGRFIFEDLLPGRKGRDEWVGKAVDVTRLSWF